MEGLAHNHSRENEFNAVAVTFGKVTIALENVRGPITEHVFTYACGKMPGGIFI